MKNLIQPADVCWFSSIKKQLHAKWNHWYLYEDKTYTNFGNMRSPGYIKCIEWLSDIWQKFDPQLLNDSFDKCGITSNNYHSALNHILKEISIINSFVDNYHEADDIDGFADVDLFEPECEEVINPIVIDRELNEINEDNDDLITSAQQPNEVVSPSNQVEKPANNEVSSIQSAESNQNEGMTFITPPLLSGHTPTFLPANNNENSNNMELDDNLIYTQLESALLPMNFNNSYLGLQYDYSQSIQYRLYPNHTQNVHPSMLAQSNMFDQAQFQPNILTHTQVQPNILNLVPSYLNNTNISMKNRVPLADISNIEAKPKRGRKPLPRDPITNKIIRNVENVMPKAKRSKKKQPN